MLLPKYLTTYILTKRVLTGFLQHALFHHVCYCSLCFIFTEVEMAEE